MAYPPHTTKTAPSTTGRTAGNTPRTAVRRVVPPTPPTSGPANSASEDASSERYYRVAVIARIPDFHSAPVRALPPTPAITEVASPNAAANAAANTSPSGSANAFSAATVGATSAMMVARTTGTATTGTATTGTATTAAATAGATYRFDRPHTSVSGGRSASPSVPQAPHFTLNKAAQNTSPPTVAAAPSPPPASLPPASLPPVNSPTISSLPLQRPAASLTMAVRQLGSSNASLRPEANNLEPIKPEPIKPEPIKPEPINSDAIKPEGIKSDAIMPDAIKPDAIKPEAIKPEVGRSERVNLAKTASAQRAPEVLESRLLEVPNPSLVNSTTAMPASLEERGSVVVVGGGAPQGASATGKPSERKSEEEAAKRSGKRWENLPEWQRLAMQGAVMVVTATLVVAISAIWTGAKRNPDPTNAKEQTTPAGPLLATTNGEAATENAAALDPNAPAGRSAVAGPASADPVNIGAPQADSARDRFATGGEQPVYPTTTPINAPSGPQLVGPYGPGPAGSGSNGLATGSSMDEDAPFTMAPTQPPAYPTTSPQRYQYPSTNPVAGPGIDPAGAGDSYPRVGENLPSRPGAPR